MQELEDHDLLENAVSYHGLELLEVIHRQQKSLPLPSSIGSQGFSGNKEEDLRKKLHQFIGRQANTIFKLGGDDKRKDWDRFDRDEQDRYVVLPPLESFMDVPSSARRRHFYKSITKGDVFVGSVASVQESGVIILMMCLDCGKSRDLRNLKITAFCATRELPRYHAHEDPLDGIQIKDKVRGVITSVNTDSEKIQASMLPWALSDNHKDMKLGLITDEELPIHFQKSKCISGQTYAMMLESSQSFQNTNMECLLNKFNIDDEKPLSFMNGLKSLNIPKHEYAGELRKMQSYKWSLRSVAEGVSHFKSGRYVEAMQHLNKALDIDTENVEALVARGALYANNENYLRAIEDFERSLELNPMHVNARKYICQTLVAYGRSLQDQKKYRDAMAFYKRALSINQEFIEAKECIAELDQQSQDESEEDVNYMELGYIQKAESESPEREGKSGSGLEKTTETLKKLIQEDEKGSSRKKKRSRKSEGTADPPTKLRKKEETSNMNPESASKPRQDSLQYEPAPRWGPDDPLAEDPHFPKEPAQSFMNISMEDIPSGEEERNETGQPTASRSPGVGKKRGSPQSRRYGSPSNRSPRRGSPGRSSRKSPSRSRRSPDRRSRSPRPDRRSSYSSGRRSPYRSRRRSRSPGKSRSPYRPNYRSFSGQSSKGPFDSRRQPSRQYTSEHSGSRRSPVTGQRSRSPAKQRSPVTGQRSRSPGKQRSPVPGQRSRSPAKQSTPVAGQRSRSPAKQRSPVIGQRSRSPTKQRSPVAGQRPRSPTKQRSPVTGQRSRSPARQRSPVPGQRARSPTKQRSPVTGQRSRSPAKQTGSPTVHLEPNQSLYSLSPHSGSSFSGIPGLDAPYNESSRLPPKYDEKATGMAEGREEYVDMRTNAVRNYMKEDEETDDYLYNEAESHDVTPANPLSRNEANLRGKEMQEEGKKERLLYARSQSPDRRQSQDRRDYPGRRPRDASGDPKYKQDLQDSTVHLREGETNYESRPARYGSWDRRSRERDSKYERSDSRYERNDSRYEPREKDSRRDPNYDSREKDKYQMKRENVQHNVQVGKLMSAINERAYPKAPEYVSPEKGSKYSSRDKDSQFEVKRAGQEYTARVDKLMSAINERAYPHDAKYVDSCGKDSRYDSQDNDLKDGSGEKDRYDSRDDKDSRIDPHDKDSRIDPRDKDSRFDPRDKDSRFDPRDKDSRFDPRDKDSRFDPRDKDSRFDPRDKDSRFDPRDKDSRFDPRDKDSRFDPRDKDSRFDPRDKESRFDPRDKDSRFDPRDKDSRFDPRDKDSRFDPRDKDSRFDPRDKESKFDPRDKDSRFDPRDKDSRFDPRDKDSRFDPRDKDSRFDPRDKDSRFDPRDKDTRFGSRAMDSQYDSRDRNSRYDPNERDSKFDLREKDVQNDRDRDSRYDLRDRYDPRESHEAGADVPDEARYGMWGKQRKSRFSEPSLDFNSPIGKTGISYLALNRSTKKEKQGYGPPSVPGTSRSDNGDMEERSGEQDSSEHPRFVHQGWLSIDKDISPKKRLDRKYSEDLKVKVAVRGGQTSRHIVKNEQDEADAVEALRENEKEGNSRLGNVDGKETNIVINVNKNERTVKNVSSVDEPLGDVVESNSQYDELQKKLQQYWKKESSVDVVAESEQEENLVKPPTTYRARKMNSSPSSSSSSSSSSSFSSSSSRSRSRSYSRGQRRSSHERRRSGSRGRRRSGSRGRRRSRSRDRRGSRSRSSRSGSRSRRYSRHRRSRSRSRSRSHHRSSSRRSHSRSRSGHGRHDKGHRGRGRGRNYLSRRSRSKSRDRKPKFRWWSPSLRKTKANQQFISGKSKEKNQQSDASPSKDPKMPGLLAKDLKTPATSLNTTSNIGDKSLTVGKVIQAKPSVPFPTKGIPKSKDSLAQMEHFLKELKERKKEELSEKFKFQLKKKSDGTVW